MIIVVTSICVALGGLQSTSDSIVIVLYSSNVG